MNVGPSLLLKLELLMGSGIDQRAHDNECGLSSLEPLDFENRPILTSCNVMLTALCYVRNIVVRKL